MIRRCRTDADFLVADRLARRCGPANGKLPSEYRKTGAVWLHEAWIDTTHVEDRTTYSVKHHDAFAMAYIDGDGILVLGNVGVAPAARGQGLQRRLIRVRERWGREQNAIRARTHCAADNGVSVSNLMRCGYTVTGFTADIDASGDGWVNLGRSLVR